MTYVILMPDDDNKICDAHIDGFNRAAVGGGVARYDAQLTEMLADDGMIPDLLIMHWTRAETAFRKLMLNFSLLTAKEAPLVLIEPWSGISGEVPNRAQDFEMNIIGVLPEHHQSPEILSSVITELTTQPAIVDSNAIRLGRPIDSDSPSIEARKVISTSIFEYALS